MQHDKQMMILLVFLLISVLPSLWGRADTKALVSKSDVEVIRDVWSSRTKQHGDVVEKAVRGLGR